MGTSAVPCSAEYPLRDRHCVIVAVCCSAKPERTNGLYAVERFPAVLSLSAGASGRAGNAGSDGRHRGAVCQSADRKGILHGTAPPDRRGILLCQGGNAGDRLSAVPCPRIPVGIPFRLPWRRKILSGKTPAGGMRRQTDIRAVRGGGRIWQGSAAYRFPRKDSPAETVRVPAPSDIRHRRRQPPQTGVAAQCGTAQAGRFPEQSPGVTPAVMLFLDCNPLHITRLLNH